MSKQALRHDVTTHQPNAALLGSMHDFDFELQQSVQNQNRSQSLGVAIAGGNFQAVYQLLVHDRVDPNASFQTELGEFLPLEYTAFVENKLIRKQIQRLLMKHGANTDALKGKKYRLYRAFNKFDWE